MHVRATLAAEDMLQNSLTEILDELNIETVVINDARDRAMLTTDSLPKVVLLDTSLMSNAEILEVLETCLPLSLPVIALVAKNGIENMDFMLKVDDFMLLPPNMNELVARIKRVVFHGKSVDDGDTTRVGELVINPANYEVTIKGRRVNLRFKEYELLRLLASSPGRVFTRESLLNQVWGYDYFGGTRTVDVHIRRLRSKIEDAEYSFIETIWNVGYRLRDIRRA